MVFQWRLRDNKSPQVSRTFLSILADLNNAIIWIVSTHPLIPKSSTHAFNNPLVTLPKAPIRIGIIVTFMFHSFFQFSSKVLVLISFFGFLQFYSDQPEQQSPLFSRFSFFFVYWLTLDLVVWLRLGDLFVSLNPREVDMSHFLGRILVMHIPFVHMGKFKLLAQFPVDHLSHPIMSSLIIMRVFHSSISWWFSSEIWVTASFQDSSQYYDRSW